MTTALFFLLQAVAGLLLAFAPVFLLGPGHRLELLIVPLVSSLGVATVGLAGLARRQKLAGDEALLRAGTTLAGSALAAALLRSFPAAGLAYWGFLFVLAGALLGFYAPHLARWQSS